MPSFFKQTAGGYGPCLASTAFAILAVIFFLTASPTLAAETLRLGQQDYYNVSPFVDILEDQGKSWTIDQVSSPAFVQRFKPYEKQTINLGLSSSAYWIRFTLAADPTGSTKTRWFLDLGNEFIEFVKLFIPLEQDKGVVWQVQEGGGHKKLRPGRFNLEKVLFDLPQNLEKPLTCYLRVESQTPLLLTPAVCTGDTFYRKLARGKGWNGVFFGIFLALFFYNLLLTLSIRDKTYFFYLVSLASLIFFIGGTMGTDGLIKDYIPFDPQTLFSLTNLALGIHFFSLILFTRSFLLIELYSRPLNYLLIGMSLFALVFGILGIWAHYFFAHVLTVFALMVCLTLLAVGMARWHSGFRTARFFTLAFVFLFAGGSVYTLTLRGLLPFSGWTRYSLQIGFSLQVLLLSLALADRINEMRKEKEKAQAALQASEVRYRSLFDGAPISLYRTDRSKFLDVNAAMVHLLGYPDRESLMSVSPATLYVNPQDRDRWQEMMKTAGMVCNFEFQVRCYDGTLAWINNTSKAVWDTQGRFVHYEGSLEDITDRKKAAAELDRHRNNLEEIITQRTADLKTVNTKLVDEIVERHRAETALRENEEKYRSLIENVNVGIFRNTGGEQGRFLQANPAVARMFGFDSLEEFMQVRVADLYQNPEERLAFIREVDKLGSIRHKALRLKKKDGSPIWASVSAKAHYDAEGQIEWLDAVIEDITERKRAEEALYESQRRLTDIINFLPDATLVIDGEGRIIAWNRAMEEMTGFKAEALLGKGNYEHAIPFYGERRPILIDLVLSSDAESETKYVHLQRKGEVLAGETYIPNLKGREVYIFATAAALRDSQGNIAGAIELIRDITDRKRAEEALEKSEKLYRGVIENSVDVFYRTDLEGKLILVSPMAVPLLAYDSVDELLGKDITRDLYADPSDRKRILEAIHKDGFVSNYEITLKRKDGTKIDVLTNSRIYKDANGNMLGIEGSMHDFSDRKRAEEALRESERRLGDIINFLPDATLVIDHQSRVIAWNRAMEELTGVKAESILGKGDYEYALAFYGERRPIIIDLVLIPDEEFEARYAHIKKQGEVLFGEAYIPTLRGGSAYFAATAAALRDSQGRITGAIEMIRDITDRKQAEAELEKAKEEAEAANRSKSEFLANMSHEIRTPMNAIMGMAHLALKTELTPRQSDYIRKIDGSARSLLGIINDILDFSKIEAGKIDIESIDFLLEDVLQNLANVTSPRLRGKALEFFFRLAPDVPLKLKGDPLRLGQVLTNLANNAAKFTERGEIVLDVGLSQWLSEGRALLRFSVRDTGIGMSREQVERVFQAFTQADASFTRRYGGTGLGLSICKRLVELMGGQIRVESTLGKGSTFSFTAAFGCSAADVKKKTYLLPETLRNMPVLVVDDSETALTIYEAYLKGFSTEPHLARSGEEALGILKNESRKRPFELVILDWQMPGMGGIETARRIMVDQDLDKKPAIFLSTSYDQEDIPRQAEEIGIKSLLFKPVTQSNLFNAIMEVLGSGAPKEARRLGRETALNGSLKAIYGARVLVAEDNEVNQQVAREILEGAGMVVTIADNGREAITMLERREFDLVFMDIQMPELDGLEATRILRSQKRFQDLPIIAMTAHAMSGDKEKSLAAGMNGHITKPIDPNELFAVLLKWIKPGARQEAVAPRPALFQDEVALPEVIEGIDIQSGLTRIGGNKRLYKNLLTKLRDDYRSYPQEIKTALTSGHPEKAEISAHTIKGVAGNVGAGTLQTCAAALETALREGEMGKVPELLSRFEEKLKEVVQALGVLGAPEEIIGPQAAGGREDLPALAQALEALKPHLQSRKPKKCTEAMESVNQAPWPQGLEKELKELNKFISRYKFKEAESLVESLLSKPVR